MKSKCDIIYLGYRIKYSYKNLVIAQSLSLSLSLFLSKSLFLDDSND